MSVSICMIMRKYLHPVTSIAFHTLRGRVGFLLQPIRSEEFFNQTAREVLLFDVKVEARIFIGVQPMGRCCLAASEPGISDSPMPPGESPHE